MVDSINHDENGGLRIARARSASPRSPVTLAADGEFEVRQPATFPLVFARNAVAANLTAAGGNFGHGTTNVTDMQLPADARLVGLSIAASGSRTAGTLTVKVQKGGASIPTAQATLDATNVKRTTMLWGYENGFPVAASDFVGVVYDTSSDWAPTNLNVFATLFFAMPL